MEFVLYNSCDYHLVDVKKYEESIIDMYDKYLMILEKSEYFKKRGPAGIRNSIITPQGKFLPEAMELQGKNSFHIINFNSPGATGAPAYAAFVIKKIQDLDFLPKAKPKKSFWNFIH